MISYLTTRQTGGTKSSNQIWLIYKEKPTIKTNEGQPNLMEWKYLKKV